MRVTGIIHYLEIINQEATLEPNKVTPARVYYMYLITA